MVRALGGLLIWKWSSERRLYSCLVFICFPSIYLPARFFLSFSLAVFLLFVSLFPSKQTTARAMQNGPAHIQWSTPQWAVWMWRSACANSNSFWTTALTSCVFHISIQDSWRSSLIDPVRYQWKTTLNKHPSSHPSVLLPSTLPLIPPSQAWCFLWVHPVETRCGYWTLHLSLYRFISWECITQQQSNFPGLPMVVEMEDCHWTQYGVI